MSEREKKDELLETVEERLQGYMQAWLTDSEFKNFLHRYDDEVGDGGKDAQKRKAVG